MQAGIAGLTRDAAEEVRKLELARLDKMLKGIYKKAIDGDTWAIGTALRISERRD